MLYRYAMPFQTIIQGRKKIMKDGSWDRGRGAFVAQMQHAKVSSAPSDPVQPDHNTKYRKVRVLLSR